MSEMTVQGSANPPAASKTCVTQLALGPAVAQLIRNQVIRDQAIHDQANSAAPPKIQDIDRNVGAAIRYARFSAGKSVSDCARALGVSDDAYEAIERGAVRAGAQMLFTLAPLFDEPIASFFCKHASAVGQALIHDI